MRPKVPSAISHQARQCCPESDEHHGRVWFCMTCKALEQRLMPIEAILGDLVTDLSVTITRWPQ